VKLYNNNYHENIVLLRRRGFVRIRFHFLCDTSTYWTGRIGSWIPFNNMRLFVVLPIFLALAAGEPPVPSSYGAPAQPQPVFRGGGGGGGGGGGQSLFGSGVGSQQYGAPAVPQPAFNQQPQQQPQYGAPVGGGASPSLFNQPQQGYSQPLQQSFEQPQRTSPPGPIQQPQTFYGQPGGGSGGPSQQYQPGQDQQQQQGGYQQDQQQQQQGGGQIHKHIYVHVAPSEPEEPKQPRERKPAPAPEKHYKILFIKAPSPSLNGEDEIQLPPPPEQKTLVYVLLQKPNLGPGGLNIATPKPTKPSKPEVYFIRYKGGQQGGQNQQYGAPGGGPDAQSNQGASPQYNAPIQARAQLPQQLPPQQQQFSQPPPQQQYSQPQVPQPQQQYGGPQPQFGGQQQPQPQYGQPQPFQGGGGGGGIGGGGLGQGGGAQPQYGAPIRK